MQVWLQVVFRQEMLMLLVIHCAAVYNVLQTLQFSNNTKAKLFFIETINMVFLLWCCDITDTSVPDSMRHTLRYHVKWECVIWQRECWRNGSEKCSVCYHSVWYKEASLYTYCILKFCLILCLYFMLVFVFSQTLILVIGNQPKQLFGCYYFVVCYH
jgi:hypothetical protein